MGRGTHKLQFRLTYSWVEKVILWMEVGSAIPVMTIFRINRATFGGKTAALPYFRY
jgi:hypothetical protein